MKDLKFDEWFEVYKAMDDRVNILEEQLIQLIAAGEAEGYSASDEQSISMLRSNLKFAKSAYRKISKIGLG
ncbi:hypothetical protein [Paenibacillus sp. 7516]|uniref:hypothetical protein n=1 Tax=Paenibacillus sp. 7516 TaxID=2022549 RepID=UPI000BA53B31|nr:hypothetical protein [Paenibacillus sp. 7516]PAF30766.1 hypothetical protein CHI14_15880 [Paenibacillus sp. 7516]